MLNFVRRLARRILVGSSTVSAGYRTESARDDRYSGWLSEPVARRQQDAFEPLLQQLRAGQPRLDFQAVAELVEATGIRSPRIVEIGCGTGIYFEVFSRLLSSVPTYVGIDYSFPMTRLGKSTYPATSFIAGDARSLPLRSACCEIVVSGTSLMHIADYETAVAEMTRASAKWCVFHTVPVLETGATKFLSKLAYGERVTEVIFNRNELEKLFDRNGLAIRQSRRSFPYDLQAVIGEKTETMSYLCEKIA